MLTGLPMIGNHRGGLQHKCAKANEATPVGNPVPFLFSQTQQPERILPMQITLNQDEIIDAVKAYVRSQINIASNQDIVIDLRAGRGENGFTATLDIVPAKKGLGIREPGAAVPREVVPASTGPAISTTPEAREPAPTTASMMAPSTLAKPASLSASTPKSNPFTKVAAAAAAVVAETPAAEPEAAQEAEPSVEDGEGLRTEAEHQAEEEAAAEASTEAPAEEPAPAAETTPAPRSIFSKAKAG